MSIKNILREILLFLRIDLTKNLKYDRLTKQIMKKYIQPNYHCVDIGCHKGEILDLMLKYAPLGKHYAFEPIHYYGTNPDDFFEFVTNEIGLKIYTLANFIQEKSSLTKQEFAANFESNAEYYFVASSK